MTGTVKHEISLRGQVSSPQAEFVMICRRDCAVALPGEEEPNKRVGDDILAFRSAAIKGGRKDLELGFLEGSIARVTPTALPDAPPPSAVPTRTHSALAPTRHGASGLRSRLGAIVAEPMAFAVSPTKKAQGGT